MTVRGSVVLTVTVGLRFILLPVRLRVGRYYDRVLIHNSLHHDAASKLQEREAGGRFWIILHPRTGARLSAQGHCP